MKYFVINTTIHDGEYEYFSQSPVQAATEAEAIKLKEAEAEEWTGHDYREYKISVHREITREEYEVISKNIY